MTAGRPRKPTALKILQGEKRPERLDVEAPVAKRGRPEKPDDLGGIASKKWDQVCDMLNELGVLSVVDPEPIEQYSRVYELWRKAESTIRKGGPRGGCFTADGGRIKAPARLFKDLALVLVRIEVELGLTPSARTRLKADPGDNGPQGKLAKYG